VPQQVGKSLDEVKALRKLREQLLEELAEFQDCIACERIRSAIARVCTIGGTAL